MDKWIERYRRRAEERYRRLDTVLARLNDSETSNDEQGERGMSNITEATIEADPNVPIIRITREFAGTPEQLLSSPAGRRSRRPTPSTSCSTTRPRSERSACP